jgi:hypothetical protein
MTRQRTQCFPQTSNALTIPGLVTIAVMLKTSRAELRDRVSRKVDFGVSLDAE